MKQKRGNNILIIVKIKMRRYQSVYAQIGCYETQKWTRHGLVSQFNYVICAEFTTLGLQPRSACTAGLFLMELTTAEQHSRSACTAGLFLMNPRTSVGQSY